MKKIFALVLIAVICLSVVSCGSSEVDVPDGMKLISNDDDLFYLFVPSDWTEGRGYGNPYAYVSGSDNSNVTVMFYLLETKPENATNREPYIDQYWAEFENSVKDLYVYDTVEEEFKDCTLGGSDIFAKQYVYTTKSSENEEYKCRAVVTYHGEMIFCLTYTSTPENYDAHAADVDKIIAEFKFK